MKDLLTILIIDHDNNLNTSLEKLLLQEGLKIIISPTDNPIQPIFKTNHIALILVDFHIPDEGDLALCNHIRTLTQAPIIMLTDVKENPNKMLTVQIPIDTYLIKKSNSNVLIAQIHSCLHKEEIKQKLDSEVYIFNGWKLNMSSRSLLSPQNKNVELTPAEFTLLHTLVTSPKRVLSRDRLLDAINANSTSFDRSIDILISRLRAKIEVDAKNASIIKTVRNMGYILSCEVVKTSTKSLP